MLEAKPGRRVEMARLVALLASTDCSYREALRAVRHIPGLPALLLEQARRTPRHADRRRVDLEGLVRLHGLNWLQRKVSSLLDRDYAAAV